MVRKKPARQAVSLQVKQGRPVLLLPAVKADICAWISGGRSLAKWCTGAGVTYEAVRLHLRDDAVFLADYERAREASADWDADATADIRERMLAGKITPEQARVAIDQLKWAAAKRQPKKYGEKLDLNHGGTIEHAHLTLDELRKRIAKSKACESPTNDA